MITIQQLLHVGHARHQARIRENIREALVRYAEEGLPLGDFLQAVIANDLGDASARADEGNALALAAIAAFVTIELPRPCWGSRRIYLAWLAWHAAARSGSAARQVAAKAELEAAWHEARR